MRERVSLGLSDLNIIDDGLFVRIVIFGSSHAGGRRHLVIYLFPEFVGRLRHLLELRLFDCYLSPEISLLPFL